MFVQLLKEFMGHKPGERLDVDDANAKFLIDSKQAEPTPDVVTPLITKALQDAYGTFTKGIEAQVERQLKEFAMAMTRSRKNAMPLIFGEGQSGDIKKTLGAFLIAVKNHDHKALEEMGSQKAEWSPEKKAALQTTVGASGGYLLPTPLRENMMQIVIEKSIVRQRALVVPMDGFPEVEVPRFDTTGTPTAGDTASLGGFVMRWQEEGGSVNESEPTFEQAKLRHHELGGYTKLSNALLRAKRSMEAILEFMFAKAVGWWEDYAFMRGNGVGKPLGFQAWPGFISVTRSAASAFALADKAGVMARFSGDYDPAHTAWVAHQTTLTKVLQLSDASGRLLPMTPVSVNGKTMMGLDGVPLCISEKCPALNTAGDIGLYDFSQYLVGDGEQIEIAFSEHAGFTSNQTYWRVVSYVAGMPWPSDKQILADATNSISPAVGLAAG